jgi:hypothetical protein
MGKLVLTTETLTTPVAGTLEYDGRVPYFTPQGAQRGLLPGMQYYRTADPILLADVATTNQEILGVAVTLAAGTTYAFEALFSLTKTASTTTHTLSYGFMGTAVTSNASIYISRFGGTSSPTITATGAIGFTSQLRNTTAPIATTAGIIANPFTDAVSMRGTFAVTTAGTITPAVSISVTIGATYSTVAGGYFLVYPIGASGSDTSVGDWS